MPEIKKQVDLYVSQQIPISLRGMYYILVSKNILKNNKNQYNYLSTYTTKARERSEIGFDNRGRAYEEDEILPIDCFIDGVRHITDIDDDYESAEQFIRRGINHIKRSDTHYKVPRWYKQPHYVEVWVEKGAMRGVLDSIINVVGKRQVRIVPTSGQESVSFAWENAQRLAQKQAEGKHVHIRYFGDLDPSGEQIERSIVEKLTEEPYSLEDIDFQRVGVTNEQRLEFNLIPNTDIDTLSKLKRDKTRFAFMNKYNLECEDDLFQIEVDALQAIAPNEFRELVLDCVDEFFQPWVYEENKVDPDVTPSKNQINEIALVHVQDLQVSLQNRLKNQV